MHPWTMQETVSEIDNRLRDGIFTQHGVVNVAKIVNMREDPDLYNAVVACDIINIDGAGVVFAGRWLGLGIPERVAGIDLFHELLELAQRRQIPVFFLGAKEEGLDTAVSNIRRDYPSLIIGGWHHGYFWEDEASVVEKISASGAKMLFVAITSPKKEIFIQRWKDDLGVQFVMGVGGTFDVVAGETKRAPVWMQRVGLEWFYRLIQEPGRMWQRYFYTNLVFGWLVLRQKFARH